MLISAKQAKRLSQHTEMIERICITIAYYAAMMKKEYTFEEISEGDRYWLRINNFELTENDDKTITVSWENAKL